ncbi:hypothetical protein BpHYR1_028473 [Brachionus plicatilis]|uniref:Uncharacterized protein n=1 Tax=Brachionus plicatilis TaxID=10195 RepID=A0A3M7ST17_BRAPC|nr:hypothetical protein BpHYR1_028473 [Brachionus plicatilis]
MFLQLRYAYLKKIKTAKIKFLRMTEIKAKPKTSYNIIIDYLIDFQLITKSKVEKIKIQYLNLFL